MGKHKDVVEKIHNDTKSEVTILILFGAEGGGGFDFKTRTEEQAAMLPTLLREVAAEIEKQRLVPQPQ